MARVLLRANPRMFFPGSSNDSILRGSIGLDNVGKLKLLTSHVSHLENLLPYHRQIQSYILREKYVNMIDILIRIGPLTKNLDAASGDIVRPLSSGATLLSGDTV